MQTLTLNGHPPQFLTDSLLLNASFIGNPGLMHGKMGISIFFYHLARQTGNKIYEDYAGELIDEIYDEITVHTPVDFENGLAGIGWGIEYLVQNGFIEADTDAVLEEFDNKISNELINNIPKELNLLKGILGMGAYFLNRIKPRVCDDNNPHVLINRQTLIHLVDELDKRTQGITEIIREPFQHLSSQTFGPLNSQTAESFTHKFQPTNKKSFDLLWDYPVLLWFLAELYQYNFFKNKTEEIIRRLTEPLKSNKHIPMLQSNKLLLVLALTKFQIALNKNPVCLVTTNREKQDKAFEEQHTSGPQHSSELLNLQTIISKLLSADRNGLKTESSSNSVPLRYGRTGIIWIYKMLYMMTRKSKFKDEFEYWNNQNLLETVDENASEEPGNIWGLMEGNSGILLIDLIN